MAEMIDISPDRPAAPNGAAGLPAPVLARIDVIAARHRAADGLLLKLANAAGGQIETGMQRLPGPVRQRIEGAATVALQTAYDVAGRSHGPGGPGTSAKAQRAHLALATVTGAVGGLGGLPTALAELPVTTTVILRAIQSIAAGHGFDPDDPLVRAEAISVFASGSPLDADDGVNTSFLGSRITLTGPAVQRLIAMVAPRFAAVLGQKLAAQALPLLGAVAGAGLNYTFTSYYQEMAHVRFSLLRIAQTHSRNAVDDAFRAAAANPRIGRM